METNNTKTYTARINGIAYRVTSDSLSGVMREIARELSVYGITEQDLHAEQMSGTTWDVIHEGIIGTITLT